MVKKSGLGKGLNVLMGESSSESGFEELKGGLKELELSKIKPNPNQPRTKFDEKELEELSESIQKCGILQPLLVHKQGNHYEIIAGERRYQAAIKAGLDKVPVQIKEVSEQEKLEIALIENLQRMDLNPIEEARGYKALIDTQKLTQEQVAQAVSKSRSAITNSLRLLDLPDEVQTYLFEGKLSAGHARAILAVPDNDARIKFAQKVVDEGLSVRNTEKLAPLFSSIGKSIPKRVATPKSFKVAARKLRQMLNTSVKVKTVGGKNKIEIEFANEEDLLRILEQIQ